MGSTVRSLSGSRLCAALELPKADPKAGSISFVSPVARLLMGFEMAALRQQWSFPLSRSVSDPRTTIVPSLSGHSDLQRRLRDEP
jgi:hypothetical protein